MSISKYLHSNKGFTIIEMLVVLAVLSAVLFLGIFTFQPIKVWMQKKLFISQLQSDLYHAHSYAINRKERIVLTFPRDNTYYSAVDQSSSVIFIRELSEPIKIAGDGTLTRFHITPDGTISNFGKVNFLLNKEKIELTVYIGRGRFVVKE